MYFLHGNLLYAQFHSLFGSEQDCGKLLYAPSESSQPRKVLGAAEDLLEGNCREWDRAWRGDDV